MLCDYDCIRKWAKIFTYCCSGAVIALGIAKFFNVTGAMNPIDYIINVYLMYYIIYNQFSFLGLIFFVCELEWEYFLLRFHFLRFFFGKCFFAVL